MWLCHSLRACGHTQSEKWRNTVEELYNALEERIRDAGYMGSVSGEEIYNEISDEIDGKENGAYVFMVKKDDDRVFEYHIEIFDTEFNLSSIIITDGADKIQIDFD